ncbi:FMN reductase [Zhengella mangrovi]|uniref:FMN reductase n=1 Tax=Zhengella mangrovi TaxID=1982044 RepID=A0A2G1QTX0_9HYPH|nr:NAD(P)H-dependent oxidoreductase [Zhengella mangrovi]PHP68973.1 FMN reductase [Zhengella mangrovi]
MIPKILVFSGSIRSGSFNGQLADAAMKTLAEAGADVTRISLADYPLPIMDEDLEKASGIPENAMKLGRLIAAHDGVFIACPEYNASIPPLLKNTIDWISRISADGATALKPWKGKPVALGAASNGMLGGIRGLYHVRAVLMNCGCHILTEQTAVRQASKAFEPSSGLLKADTGQPLLETTCRALMEYCAAFTRR